MTTNTIPTLAPIPIYLETENLDVIKYISRSEHIPEDVLLRKFVLDGLADFRLDAACRAYAKGRLNLSGASRMAGLGVEEFMMHLKRRGIEFGPSYEQVLDGLATLAENFDNDILRQVVKEERAKYKANDSDSSSPASV